MKHIFIINPTAGKTDSRQKIASQTCTMGANNVFISISSW